MRKQYLSWTIAVFGVFGTTYGAYLLAYHFNHGNGFNVMAFLLLLFGVSALVFSIVLNTLSYITKRRKKDEPVSAVIEEKEIEEEKVVEPVVKEEKPELKPVQKQREYTSREKISYGSSSSYSSSTVYVKQVGYGPLLRVNGNRICDMRNNTYYRIEGNMVNQEGYGPIFEIRGNQIKDAFGGYLYDLSGSNINKTYGGFYASVSGNYMTLFDASIKYEMTDSLSKRQILVVAALLFGKY